MAKKVLETKEKVRVKKRRGSKLIKFIFTYAVVRTTIKIAGILVDKYNEGGYVSQDGDILKYSVAFNGRNVKIENETFKGAVINTICSGMKMDLGNADIEDDVDIYCKNLMGGISIIVPENVKVDITAKSVFGSVANNVPYVENETAPIIHIHADNIMAGIEVKGKEPPSSIQ